MDLPPKTVIRMPVIEEIDDDEIDSKHFSLDDFDPHNPFSKDMPLQEGAPVQLRPTQQPAPQASSNGRSTGAAGINMNDMIPDAVDSSMDPNTPRGKDLPEHMKSWKVLYPVYFDKTRSVKQGRRVPYEQAVLNPLAVIISDACLSLGFEAALEITKQHPKDWANPGRVRVNLKDGSSKRDIYKKISAYLKSKTVTPVSAREDLYRRIAQFDSLQPLATPRNMRFPKILPGVSPALSARKMIDESMKMDGNEMAKMMGMSR